MESKIFHIYKYTEYTYLHVFTYPNLTHTLSESKHNVYTFVQILQPYDVTVFENIK
jgi:hypothetical protein